MVHSIYKQEGVYRGGTLYSYIGKTQKWDPEWHQTYAALRVEQGPPTWPSGSLWVPV